MAFSISSTTANVGATITAIGTGTKKRPTRIRIDNIIVAEFPMPGNNKFTKAVIVPDRSTGNYQVVLQQQGTDNVWRQTASILDGLNIVKVSTQPVPTGPIISNVSATSITQTSVVINWSLNQPATGQVEYGTTTNYGKFTTEETSFNYSSHVQSISNLTAGTPYHYRIKSKNQAGILTVSGDFTFTTLSAPSPTLPEAPKNLTATPLDRSVRLGWN